MPEHSLQFGRPVECAQRYDDGAEAGDRQERDPRKLRSIGVEDGHMAALANASLQQTLRQSG